MKQRFGGNKDKTNLVGYELCMTIIIIIILYACGYFKQQKINPSLAKRQVDFLALNDVEETDDQMVCDPY